MEFDRFTLALLRSTPKRTPLAPPEADRLQDEHMAYLAQLHERGELLMAGPVPGGPDSTLRGIALFRTSIDEAQNLGNGDPMVRAGQLTYQCFPWMVPGGAANFSKTHFPRAMSQI